MAKRRARRVIMTMIAFLAALPVAAGLFCLSYLLGLPEWKEFDPSEVAAMSEASVMYAADNSELLLLPAREKRIAVDIDTLPAHVPAAFVAVEDARFYEHNGVDIIRIAGAVVADIRSGSLSQGGSTISQQLIKNTVLTAEKRLDRKLNEAVMAIKLEQHYTKREILEMYLNQSYFGRGAYGIEAAARLYFGIHAHELTAAQAATLAATLKAPSTYAPHIDPDKSDRRRNMVIDLMAEHGFISDKTAAAEKKAETQVAELPENSYGFYTDMAVDEACAVLNVTREQLNDGGYRIYTTFDAAAQNAANAAWVQNELFPENAADGVMCEAAYVCIDNDTGGICAVMGAREYTTAFGLNRATASRRQPGSAIKPVMVYAPALERLSFSPTTFILDETADFGGYIPRNFSGRTSGWVTLRDCVAKSLNIPAVKVLNLLGVSAAKQYASSVGIEFDETDDSLTLALGGFTVGVTPADLAASYTPFATGGIYSEPYCVSRITDAQGNSIYERTGGRAYVLSPSSAYLMTSMLASTVEYGTAKRLRTDGVNIAAKTGTAATDSLSSGNSDSWIVAYTPDYTSCIWMGYDYTDDEHCLPADITGGTAPALLMKSIYTDIYKDRTCADFSVPAGIVRVRIDDGVLMREKRAVRAAGAGSQWRYEYYTRENAPGFSHANTLNID